jgi:hypothetical protein
LLLVLVEQLILKAMDQTQLVLVTQQLVAVVVDLVAAVCLVVVVDLVADKVVLLEADHTQALALELLAKVTLAVIA